MYGTQTPHVNLFLLSPFENDVKMYGTQTLDPLAQMFMQFENDVKMYGTQTASRAATDSHRV